ncbi:MAG TPA: hybrid sensor histidine kinase/response regulator [Candidatus Paceibacterota bacterium]|nr:hybrid sensor histidine kinase/response regulator [Verrucomicrobiota bacterium]HSA10189.1 hybrid sensor histidine kinase/response regulator [Candidatus Paceibacterota bacterium]
MKRILVIDDDESLRDMVRAALDQKGFEVLEADSGVAGIEKARKELPDLILCDVQMQHMDGYLTLSVLRNEPTTAAIPVILMTGQPDHSGMRHSMELGADDYLPKPFTLDSLYAAVNTRLKKAQVLRQEAEKQLADLRDNISLMLPHELRTPLNGILAYGELLAVEAGRLPASEVAEMGQVIHDSGKRLERLVENFLIYAQIELLGADAQKVTALRQKETRSPAKLVEEHARDQAYAASRSDDLVLDLADVPVPISADYLAKIVDELVQNAFKFSERGRQVTVTLSESSNSVVLSVSDRGRGFSTEHITKVGAFMQFDRKVLEQQGLGLGLVIAKRLSELHGGALSIQSERGATTTVTVRLPKAPAS